MPKDRLQELRNAASLHGLGDEEEMEVGTKTPFKVHFKKKKNKAAGESAEGAGEANGVPSTFLKDIEWLAENLKNLSDRIEDIKATQMSFITTSVNDKAISAAKREKVKQQSNAIKNLAGIIQKELKVMEEKIKAEERENEKREEMGERKLYWAELRIRKSQYQAKMQAFTNAMTVYNDHQLQYREACKLSIKNTLGIAKQTMTEGEIDEMLESEDPHIYTQQFQTLARQAKLDLQEMTERHDELLQVEESIRQIRDMFVEVSLLVGQQGELIDRVETQMEEAKEWVEQSKKQMQEALIKKKKANKRKICLITVGVCILVILILLITISITFG